MVCEAVRKAYWVVCEAVGKHEEFLVPARLGGLSFDPLERAYCMTASQFDTNQAKCRILPCKAEGVFASSVLEELSFDPLRRAYCMTASQFDTNRAKCRILPRKADGLLRTPPGEA